MRDSATQNFREKDAFHETIDMDEEILTQDELQRAVQRIFKLAQTDVEFRRLCLRDPVEAIRQITGKSPRPGLKIHFLEPEPDEAKKTSS